MSDLKFRSIWAVAGPADQLEEPGDAQVRKADGSFKTVRIVHVSAPYRDKQGAPVALGYLEPDNSAAKKKKRYPRRAGTRPVRDVSTRLQQSAARTGISADALAKLLED